MAAAADGEELLKVLPFVAMQRTAGPGESSDVPADLILRSFFVLRAPPGSPAAGQGSAARLGDAIFDVAGGLYVHPTASSPAFSVAQAGTPWVADNLAGAGVRGPRWPYLRAGLVGNATTPLAYFPPRANIDLRLVEFRHLAPPQHNLQEAHQRTDDNAYAPWVTVSRRVWDIATNPNRAPLWQGAAPDRARTVAAMAGYLPRWWPWTPELDGLLDDSAVAAGWSLPDRPRDPKGLLGASRPSAGSLLLAAARAAGGTSAAVDAAVARGIADEEKRKKKREAARAAVAGKIARGAPRDWTADSESSFADEDEGEDEGEDEDGEEEYDGNYTFTVSFDEGKHSVSWKTRAATAHLLFPGEMARAAWRKRLRAEHAAWTAQLRAEAAGDGGGGGKAALHHAAQAEGTPRAAHAQVHYDADTAAKRLAGYDPDGRDQRWWNAPARVAALLQKIAALFDTALAVATSAAEAGVVRSRLGLAEPVPAHDPTRESLASYAVVLVWTVIGRGVEGAAQTRIGSFIWLLAFLAVEMGTEETYPSSEEEGDAPAPHRLSLSAAMLTAFVLVVVAETDDVMVAETFGSRELANEDLVTRQLARLRVAWDVVHEYAGRLVPQGGPALKAYLLEVVLAAVERLHAAALSEAPGVAGVAEPLVRTFVQVAEPAARSFAHSTFAEQRDEWERFEAQRVPDIPRERANPGGESEAQRTPTGRVSIRFGVGRAPPGRGTTAGRRPALRADAPARPRLSLTDLGGGRVRLAVGRGEGGR